MYGCCEAVVCDVLDVSKRAKKLFSSSASETLESTVVVLRPL